MWVEDFVAAHLYRLFSPSGREVERAEALGDGDQVDLDDVRCLGSMRWQGEIRHPESIDLAPGNTVCGGKVAVTCSTDAGGLGRELPNDRRNLAGPRAFGRIDGGRVV